jgi:hypothetical protein
LTQVTHEASGLNLLCRLFGYLNPRLSNALYLFSMVAMTT